MDAKKAAALTAAGYSVSDATEFLGLSEFEVSLIEVRLALSRLIRRVRAEKNLTQGELAHRTGSSQSRIAKVEAGGRGITLDLQFRCLFAAGGRVEDIINELAAAIADPRTAKKPIRKEGVKVGKKVSVGPLRATEQKTGRVIRSGRPLPQKTGA